MTSTIMNTTDGYKLGHRQQYPEGTQQIFSNLTARTSRTAENYIVLFGLQGFIKRWMEEEFANFFASDIDEICTQYERRVNSYLGPNTVGSDHIRALHNLGYVPLAFYALPEGTRVPLRVPMLVVTNTVFDFFWLVNYIETLMSAELWLPITSATTSYSYRRLFNEAGDRTGTDEFFRSIQGHDFSMRGHTSIESAAKSGAAHLLSSRGTDTLPALDYIEKYYPVVNDDPMYMTGISVNATEHAVMCAGTSVMGEFETFERLITDVYPVGIVSIVADTFDLWETLTGFMPRLKHLIMAREGKVVIRPDSGDPVKILCGDPDEPAGSPEHKGVVELLWDTFGGTETSTGHRQLDEHVGAIYGDAITLERAEQITDQLAAKGFSSGNVVFGIGSYTFQMVTRDTYGMAIKATAAIVNGELFELFKDPITDSGTKKSARGLLKVVLNDAGELELVDQITMSEFYADDNELKLVWEDGNFTRTQGFDEVRAVLGAQE